MDNNDSKLKEWLDFIGEDYDYYYKLSEHCAIDMRRPKNEALEREIAELYKKEKDNKC